MPGSTCGIVSSPRKRIWPLLRHHTQALVSHLRRRHSAVQHAPRHRSRLCADEKHARPHSAHRKRRRSRCQPQVLARRLRRSLPLPVWNARSYANHGDGPPGTCTAYKPVRAPAGLCRLRTHRGRGSCGACPPAPPPLGDAAFVAATVRSFTTLPRHVLPSISSTWVCSR